MSNLEMQDIDWHRLKVGAALLDKVGYDPEEALEDLMTLGKEIITLRARLAKAEKLANNVDGAIIAMFDDYDEECGECGGNEDECRNGDCLRSCLIKSVSEFRKEG